METALRRLDGVEKISINMPKQKFQVSYKPGSSFLPRGIRDAVGKAGVTVVQFQITARGHVQAEGTKRFFIAGKNRFSLVDSPQIPPDKPVSVLGTVDDAAEPFLLKVTEFKLLKQ